jgi:hypothetical protein
LGATSGSVVVRVNGVTSNSSVFNVTEKLPQINSTNPVTNQPGEAIEIHGTNFGTDKNIGNIDFNGIVVDGKNVIAWNDKLLYLVVPDKARSGPLQVSVNGVKSNAFYVKISVFYYQLKGITFENKSPYDTEVFKATSVFGENFAEFTQEYKNPTVEYSGKNTVRGTWVIPPEKFYIKDKVETKVTSNLVSGKGNLGYQVITAASNLGPRLSVSTGIGSSSIEKQYSEKTDIIYNGLSYYTGQTFIISFSVQPYYQHLGSAKTIYTYEMKEE